MSHTGLFCTFFLLTTGRKKQKERPFFVRPIAPHTVFSLERDGAITFISLELHTHTHTQKTTSSRPPHRYHKQDKQENEKKNNNNTKKKVGKICAGKFACTQRHFKHGRDVNKLTPVITILSAVFPV
jgi:hypothetical protein